MKNTAKSRILNVLASGKTLTTAQGRARFGIVNVPARVAELRQDGHRIATNVRGEGTSKTFSYSLGTKAAKAASRK